MVNIYSKFSRCTVMSETREFCAPDMFLDLLGFLPFWLIDKVILSKIQRFSKHMKLDDMHYERE